MPTTAVALATTPAAARPGPEILNAHFDTPVVAGVPNALVVKARDPLAAINGLQITFGDGSRVDLSACRAPAATGVFGAGKQVVFPVGHTYAAGGSFDVHVIATSGDCSTLGAAVSTQDVNVHVLAAPKAPGVRKPDQPPVAGAALAPACANMNALPATASVRAMRGSVLCLVNYYRALKGLGRLRTNAKLTRAAQRHATDMVAHNYFSHGNLTARLAHAHFHLHGSAGENLAAGTSNYGTPLGTLYSWMFSPPHNANLLNPRFRLAGIGVARGMPTLSDPSAGTYDLMLASG